jgi:4-hydroxybenzoate polyprenyltransferase
MAHSNTPTWVEEGESRISIAGIFTASLGYFLAGLTSMVAGYFAANGAAMPSASRLLPMVVLLILLAAVCLNHATCYEQEGIRLSGNGQSRQLAIVLPVTMAASGVLVAAVAQLITPAIGSKPAIDAIRSVLTVLPLIVLAVYRSYRWVTFHPLIQFRYRCFFPALATCLPFFVYGFADDGPLTAPLLACFSILALWIVSRVAVRTRIVTFTGIFALFAGVVYMVFAPSLPGGEEARTSITACVFGVFLTLAMGVTEAWRVTTRVMAGVEYRGEAGYEPREKEQFLGGTNIAVAACLPMFLLTYLHPATTSIYPWLTVACLLTYYALWFGVRTYSDYRRWKWFSVAAGLGLPLAVASGVTVRLRPTAASSLVPFAASINTCITIIAAAIALAAYGIKFTRLPTALRRNTARKFVDWRRSIGLTAIVASVLTVVTAASLCGIGENAQSAMFVVRLRTLTVLYLIVAALCVFTLFWYQQSYGTINFEATDANIDERESADNALAFVRLTTMLHLLRTGRPLTSALAASLSVFVLVAARIDDSVLLSRTFVAMALLTMCGFIANDIFDVDKDRRAAVLRPIARGLLSLAYARRGLLVLSVISFAISPATAGARIVWSATYALVLLYSLVARRLPLYKGIYTAALSCTPVAYAAAISGREIALVPLSILIVFIVGRETVLDALDSSADAAIGMCTVAHLLGERRATIVGILAMSGAALATVVLSNTVVGWLVASGACISLGLSTLWPELPMRQRIASTRLAMFLGSIALSLVALRP